MNTSEEEYSERTSDQKNNRRQDTHGNYMQNSDYRTQRQSPESRYNDSVSKNNQNLYKNRLQASDFRNTDPVSEGQDQRRGLDRNRTQKYGYKVSGGNYQRQSSYQNKTHTPDVKHNTLSEERRDQRQDMDRNREPVSQSHRDRSSEQRQETCRDVPEEESGQRYDEYGTNRQAPESAYNARRPTERNYQDHGSYSRQTSGFRGDTKNYESNQEDIIRKRNVEQNDRRDNLHSRNNENVVPFSDQRNRLHSKEPNVADRYVTTPASSNIRGPVQKQLQNELKTDEIQVENYAPQTNTHAQNRNGNIPVTRQVSETKMRADNRVYSENKQSETQKVVLNNQPLVSSENNNYKPYSAPKGRGRGRGCRQNSDRGIPKSVQQFHKDKGFENSLNEVQTSVENMHVGTLEFYNKNCDYQANSYSSSEINSSGFPTYRNTVDDNIEQPTYENTFHNVGNKGNISQSGPQTWDNTRPDNVYLKNEYDKSQLSQKKSNSREVPCLNVENRLYSNQKLDNGRGDPSHLTGSLIKNVVNPNTGQNYRAEYDAKNAVESTVVATKNQNIPDGLAEGFEYKTWNSQSAGMPGCIQYPQQMVRNNFQKYGSGGVKQHLQYDGSISTQMPDLRRSKTETHEKVNVNEIYDKQVPTNAQNLYYPQQFAHTPAQQHISHYVPENSASCSETKPGINSNMSPSEPLNTGFQKPIPYQPQKPESQSQLQRGYKAVVNEGTDQQFRGHKWQSSPNTAYPGLNESVDQQFRRHEPHMRPNTTYAGLNQSADQQFRGQDSQTRTNNAYAGLNQSADQQFRGKDSQTRTNNAYAQSQYESYNLSAQKETYKHVSLASGQSNNQNGQGVSPFSNQTVPLTSGRANNSSGINTQVVSYDHSSSLYVPTDYVDNLYEEGNRTNIQYDQTAYNNFVVVNGSLCYNAQPYYEYEEPVQYILGPVNATVYKNDLGTQLNNNTDIGTVPYDSNVGTQLYDDNSVGTQPYNDNSDLGTELYTNDIGTELDNTEVGTYPYGKSEQSDASYGEYFDVSVENEPLEDYSCANEDSSEEVPQILDEKPQQDQVELWADDVEGLPFINPNSCSSKDDCWSEMGVLDLQAILCIINRILHDTEKVNEYDILHFFIHKEGRNERTVTVEECSDGSETLTMLLTNDQYSPVKATGASPKKNYKSKKSKSKFGSRKTAYSQASKRYQQSVEEELQQSVEEELVEEDDGDEEWEDISD